MKKSVNTPKNSASNNEKSFFNSSTRRQLALKIILYLVVMLTISNSKAQIIGDSTDILWETPLSGSIYDIEFSQDSKYIAVAQNLVLNIFSIDSNVPFKKIISDATFWSCAYSPDGKTLAATLRSGYIKVWETENWIEIFSKKLDEEFMNEIKFSNDGEYLGIAAGRFGLLILKNKTWEIIKEIKDFPFINDPKFGGSPLAYNIQFSPLSSNILSFSGDWSFVFNLNLDTIIKKLSGIGPKYSPDNQFIATKDINSLLIYDTKDYNLIKKFQMGTSVFGFCFSPDGKYIIIAAEDVNPGLIVYDTDNFDEKKIFTYHGEKRPVRQVSISGDGQCLATQTAGYFILYKANWNPSEINESNRQEMNVLYPNPASGDVQISIPEVSSGRITLNVIDESGKIIDTKEIGGIQNGQNTISYNTSFLPVGFYFIKMQTGTTLKTYKLIMEK